LSVPLCCGLTSQEHSPTDEGASKGQECLMDVCTPFIAHLESTKPIEPGERPLHRPAIAPQSFTRLDATPCDPRDDTTSTQRAPTARILVALIGMQLHGPLAWSPTMLARQTQRRNGVNRHVQLLAVIHIGSRDGHRQRHTSAVHDDVTLRAQLATIRRGLAGLVAPLERVHSRYRAMHASSQCAPHLATVVGAHDAGASTRPLPA